MGHGSTYRDVEVLAGRYGCGSLYTTDIGCTSAVDSSIIVVGTSGTKVRYRAIPCRTNDTSCLGRNQGLMVNLG